MKPVATTDDNRAPSLALNPGMYLSDQPAIRSDHGVRYFIREDHVEEKKNRREKKDQANDGILCRGNQVSQAMELLRLQKERNNDCQADHGNQSGTIHQHQDIPVHLVGKQVSALILRTGHIVLFMRGVFDSDIEDMIYFIEKNTGVKK